jgi:hypothetical protein
MAILFRPFDFIASEHIYIIWLSNLWYLILSVPDDGYIYIERTWWRLYIYW